MQNKQAIIKKMNNDKQKWNECLSIIRDVIPEEQFKCWFEPIYPVSFVDDRLTISVPSSYFAEHIDERYIRILGPVLHRVYGPKVKLEYSYKVVNDAPESVNVRSENPSPAIKSGLPAANPFNVESVPEID